MMSDIDDLIVGLSVPAAVGMPVDDVCTPALIIDLDAFERNIVKLRDRTEAFGIRHRAHAKTHKSADIALRQMQLGGACGVCCQKVAEAESLIDAGVGDVLVSNQVTDPAKINRLAALANRARVQVCVDDLSNVAELSRSATRHGVRLDCLVEIDVGAHRCGVAPGAPAVELAQAIDAADGLRFTGLQAYQGSAQHIVDYEKRRAAIHQSSQLARETVDRLGEAGLACDTVTGAGTGSFEFEADSGVYNELQCGSYIFMDADYQRIHDATGLPITQFENSLFILTSVMSVARPGQAVCDAGLKSQSVDSGLPVVFGRDDVRYAKCSDEHGVIDDPANQLALNDRLKLIPGHCDPTCNLYDWYVGIRADRVECLWPVTARGMGY